MTDLGVYLGVSCTMPDHNLLISCGNQVQFDSPYGYQASISPNKESLSGALGRGVALGLGPIGSLYIGGISLYENDRRNQRKFSAHTTENNRERRYQLL